MTEPVVGASYLLADADYRFGRGPLLARVTRVVAPVDFGEGGRVELWWQIEAVCVIPGYVGGGERSLYVRASCLPATRRG